MVGQHRGTRQFDHRADAVIDRRPGFGEHLGGDLIHLRPGDIEFLLHPHQRDHDLRMRRLAGFLGDRDGALEDRARLHLVNLGIRDAQAAAAMAEHGVGFF